MPVNPDLRQGNMGFAMRHSLSAVIAVLLVAAVSPTSADWPQFRGPNRDGIYPGRQTVPDFPEGGPLVVWERPIGAGFSAPVAARGRMILFHRLGGKEVVESIVAESGETVWKSETATTYRDDFGFDEGPRATPVAGGGQIYTFGAQGVLRCLEFATGRTLWSLDTHREFGVRKGFFGAASTPLALGSRLFANIGGSGGAGIIAVDKDTGRLLWQATDHEASYSSPVAAEFEGETLIVFFTREGLAALDPSSGEVRFERRWRSRSRASVNAATPIVSGGTIFLSASYGTGAVALRVRGGVLEELWSGGDSLNNHYSTSVLADGVLYGFHGRQEYGQSFRAVELASGKVLWSEEQYGAGTVTRVGDRLLLLRESGELDLLAVSPEAFRSVSRSQILPAKTRSYPALADGLFFARDKNTLVCLRLWKE